MTGFRMRLHRAPVERLDLKVGDRIKFAAEKAPYRVRAVSSDGRFIVCTKPFNPKRTVLYTVIDFDSGVRGPDDHHGLGYETDEDVSGSLALFEDGTAEVSVRRDVRLDIEHVDRSRRVDRVGPAAGGAS